MKFAMKEALVLTIPDGGYGPDRWRESSRFVFYIDTDAEKIAFIDWYTTKLQVTDLFQNADTPFRGLMANFPNGSSALYFECEFEFLEEHGVCERPGQKKANALAGRHGRLALWGGARPHLYAEMNKWIKISVIVAAPVCVLTMVKDLLFVEHAHRKEGPEPDYMRIRNKEFPWECEDCELFNSECWKKCREERAAEGN